MHNLEKGCTGFLTKLKGRTVVKKVDLDTLSTKNGVLQQMLHERHWQTKTANED